MKIMYFQKTLSKGEVLSPVPLQLKQPTIFTSDVLKEVGCHGYKNRMIQALALI